MRARFLHSIHGLSCGNDTWRRTDTHFTFCFFQFPIQCMDFSNNLLPLCTIRRIMENLNHNGSTLNMEHEQPREVRRSYKKKWRRLSILTSTNFTIWYLVACFLSAFFASAIALSSNSFCNLKFSPSIGSPFSVFFRMTRCRSRISWDIGAILSWLLVLSA